MSTLADLVVNIKADTAKLETALGQAEKKTSNLGANLAKIGAIAVTAGVTAAAGIGKIVSKTAEAGDEIQKMALRTGLSTEALSEWKHMAELGGTSLSSVETAVKKMGGAVEDAKDGLETYTRAFDKLGVKVEDLEGMSPDEMFNTITQAVAGIEDPVQRSALAMDIFGRSGTDLLPILESGVDGMNEQKQAAHDLGIVFSQDAANDAAAFNDSITNLKATFAGLGNELGQTLMPLMTSLVDSLSGVVKNFQPIIEVISEAAADVFPILAETLSVVIKAFAPLVEKTLPVLMKLASGILSALTPIAEAVLPVLAQILGKVIDAFAPLIEKSLPLFMKLMDPLLELLLALLDAFMPIIDVALAGIVAGMEILIAVISPVIDGIALVISWLAEGVKAFTGFISKALEPVIEGFKSFGENAKNIIGGVVKFFTSIWEGVVTWFKSIPEKIGNAFAVIKDFLLAPVRAAVSGIETAINWIIGALNKLSFDVPDWVPELGGKTFGFNISKITLPSFDTGGIVPGAIGEPQLAIVHGGETVVPHGQTGMSINFNEAVFVDNEDTMYRFAEIINQKIQQQNRYQFGNAYSG